MNTLVIWTHAFYLAISMGFTIWVARTLFRSGRVFLVDSFLGNEKLADSVNHLLVVGFYLINFGYVSLAVKYGAAPKNLQEVFEVICWKVGLVLLILGVFHLLNLFLFTRARKNAMEAAACAQGVDRAGQIGPPALPTQ